MLRTRDRYFCRFNAFVPGFDVSEKNLCEEKLKTREELAKRREESARRAEIEHDQRVRDEVNKYVVC